MARGKYLSLEEARKAGKLNRFAKEHPSEGDERAFDEALEKMTLSNRKLEKPDKRTRKRKER